MRITLIINKIIASKSKLYTKYIGLVNSHCNAK